MDSRPLPPGWISQWDSNAGRYFFVDTTKTPPVSTWDDPRETPEFDAPPPYTPPQEPANKMPMAMPSANNYSASSTYPPSDSKTPAYPAYPSQGGYPGQPQLGGYPGQPQPGGYPDKSQPGGYPDKSQPGGYPDKPQPGGYPGQPQPNSYNPYTQYNDASTSAAAPPKKSGFLGKLGLGSSSNKQKYKPPVAALGTAAALGTLAHTSSHHKKKAGLGLGTGLGLGLGGAAAGMLIGKSLFKGGFKGGFGGGFGGCDNDWDCGGWD